MDDIKKLATEEIATELRGWKVKKVKGLLKEISDFENKIKEDKEAIDIIQNCTKIIKEEENNSTSLTFSGGNYSTTSNCIFR